MNITDDENIYIEYPNFSYKVITENDVDNISITGLGLIIYYKEEEIYNYKYINYKEAIIFIENYIKLNRDLKLNELLNE